MYYNTLYIYIYMCVHIWIKWHYSIDRSSKHSFIGVGCTENTFHRRRFLLSLYYFVAVINEMKVKIHKIVSKLVVEYDIIIGIQYM